MTAITTKDEFTRFAENFKASDRFRTPLLFAIGGKVITSGGILASVRYPLVNGPGTNLGTAAVLMDALNIEPLGVQNVRLSRTDITGILQHYFKPFEGESEHANINVLRKALTGSVPAVASFIFNDVDPIGVEDSTLKLYGLSNRFFKPNELKLTKIFTKLPNVAWIGDIPYDEEEVDHALTDTAFNGKDFAPHMVDKFPLYTHRINAIKMGVRITDQHKVRLGAHLGAGTTLMPGASYINFNAGTAGGAMVEGRISSSAFVGDGSDVGGGASILGTLSGGNAMPISIGRNCLLEANSTLGIPIGDAVIVAAETAILQSSQVRICIVGHPLYGKTVKGEQLIGMNAVTFRRNDTNGVLEMVRTIRNIEFAKKLEEGDSILSLDLHRK